VIDPHDCLRPRPRGRCVCGPRKLPKPSPTGWPAPTSCSVSASPVIGQRQTKMLARRAPTGTMTLGNRRGFGPRVPRAHVQSCDDPATVQVDDWPNETTVACFGLRIVRHRHGHSSIKATEVYPKHLTSKEQLRERGFAASGTKGSTDAYGTGGAIGSFGKLPPSAQPTTGVAQPTGRNACHDPKQVIQ
jgi:hypothetical protein